LRPTRLFLFELSLALGIPHPDFLIEQLSSRQISEWIAFARIQPLGESRSDWRMGRLAALIANIHRAKDAPEYRPEDFYEPYEPPSQDDLSARLQAFFKRYE